jgi:hypothetical protein
MMVHSAPRFFEVFRSNTKRRWPFRIEAAGAEAAQSITITIATTTRCAQ